MNSDKKTQAPEVEYTQRLQNRRTLWKQAERHVNLISNLRLGAFVFFALLLWLSVGARVIHSIWLILPVLIFVALIIIHDRAIRQSSRAVREANFYEKGLERLKGEWIGQGIDGSSFTDPEHVFATDLDLFGNGSLFERLCSARTRAGEETLASWLLSPASPDLIRQRQAAVEELRNNLNLREDLALSGEDIRARIEPSDLCSWATQPRILEGKTIPLISTLLSFSSILTLTGWILLGFGPIPFVVSISTQWFLGWRTRDEVAKVVGTVDRPRHELSVLALVLQRLESEDFQTDYLRERVASLKEDETASKRIADLGKLADLLAAKNNQFFLPIAFVLGWSLHLSFAIERWRARSGSRVSRWLEALGELEALASLSSFAFECPDYPFPTIVDSGPIFEAKNISHPLLPNAVPNDLELGGEHCRALLVSGSNMSGKSTLLRTVGVNAVLALAGAPVSAVSLRISPLSLGATLRVMDSLQEGASRFYAEIKRLKKITDLTKKPPPVLFLLDEILHGTNSHDRSIGAKAVIKGLLDATAIGLLTTHDLALSDMEKEFGETIRNVHFQDHIENERIQFDYIMRPGVVKKSNALELMRAVGLEI